MSGTAKKRAQARRTRKLPAGALGMATAVALLAAFLLLPAADSKWVGAIGYAWVLGLLLGRMLWEGYRD